jgi:hypothetical protein
MKRVKDHKYLYRRGDVLHFRRSIPPYARQFFDGQTEMWVSLGTVSIAEARHLLGKHLAVFERKIAQATKRVAPVDVAVPVERRPDRNELGEAVREWFASRIDRLHVDFQQSGSDIKRQAQELEFLISTVRSAIIGEDELPLATQWIVEEIITQQGWHLDTETYEYAFLARLVGRGQIEAAERQLREIAGLPHKVIDETFSPDQYVIDEQRRRQRFAQLPVSLHDLFNGYAAEKKPAAATIKAWTRQLRAFTDFLGHNDAVRITRDDVVRWKEHLLSRKERPLSAKTVADT